MSEIDREVNDMFASWLYREEYEDTIAEWIDSEVHDEKIGGRGGG